MLKKMNKKGMELEEILKILLWVGFLILAGFGIWKLVADLVGVS